MGFFWTTYTHSQRYPQRELESCSYNNLLGSKPKIALLMQKFLGEMARIFFNSLWRGWFGRGGSFRCFEFPLWKDFSFSVDCIRSLERPGNKNTTADSLLRERYKKNHHENLPEEGSLRRQTKLWTIIMLNFLQSFPWNFLTANESRHMSLYVELLSK